MMEILFWLIGWGAIGALVGYGIGSIKGKPMNGAVMGLLFGPLAWLVMIFAPDSRPKCPFCRGSIVKGAVRCKNCGSDLPRCPNCNKLQGSVNTPQCKHCGVSLIRRENPPADNYGG